MSNSTTDFTADEFSKKQKKPNRFLLTQTAQHEKDDFLIIMFLNDFS